MKTVRITEFEKKTGVKLTLTHNDKMSGLTSLSTSPCNNEICKKRAENKNSICSHCYSITMNKRFTNLAKKLMKNGEILKYQILDIMPILYSETGFFRFEAFGDIETEIQVVNYFNIASANKNIKCALWTKNPWIIASAIEKYNLKKPKNLSIIGSSWFTNKPMINYYSKFDFINNIFTVYDAKTIENENININCGARSCADCGKCYTKKHKSFEINEKLK